MKYTEINCVGVGTALILLILTTTHTSAESSELDAFYSDEYQEYGDYSSPGQQQDHEWDLLVFTQQWPLTSCFQWEEEDKKHTCQLPKKNFWTIHGIWPTKIGEFGPSFCNKSAHFDINQLVQIRNDLDTFWPTIHGAPDDDDDWLWKHEWLKHGTCALLLEELNDEVKYFGQGLQWRDEFLLTRILSDSGIHPDSSNTVIALHTALVKVLKKNPSIHCVYDQKEDISYLLEIRVCFNKTLELVDCDGVKLGDTVLVNYPGGTVNTNCHVSKPVYYPATVPPVQLENKPWKFPVVNLFKLVQFIMWFTL